jgi:hypothetical protein
MEPVNAVEGLRKYQRLQSERKRAQRAYDAALSEAEYCKAVYHFIYDVYHPINAGMDKSIRRLFQMSKHAKSKSDRYYVTGEKRFGRQFGTFHTQLRSDAAELIPLRKHISKEIETAKQCQQKAVDDLDEALKASIIADNNFFEYCKRIEERAKSIVKGDADMEED